MERSAQDLLAICTDLGIDPAAARVNEEGWDFLVVTDGVLVARFPRRREDAHRLEIETRFLAEFAPGSPIPVPRPTLVNVGEIHCALYAFLPGLALAPPQVATWEDGRLLDAGREIGKFLAQLHSFPIETASHLGIPLSGTKHTWLTKLDGLREVVYPMLDAAARAWTESLYASFFQAIEANPPRECVIHSDLGPDHLLWDESTRSLIGIIDFGDVEIGDPVFDFSALHLYGPELFQRASQVYWHERDLGWEARRTFYVEGAAVRARRNRIRRDEVDVVEQLLEIVHRQVQGESLLSGSFAWSKAVP